MTEAGATPEQTRALGLTYPREVFSLERIEEGIGEGAKPTPGK